MFVDQLEERHETRRRPQTSGPVHTGCRSTFGTTLHANPLMLLVSYVNTPSCMTPSVRCSAFSVNRAPARCILCTICYLCLQVAKTRHLHFVDQLGEEQETRGDPHLSLLCFEQISCLCLQVAERRRSSTRSRAPR